MTTTEAPPRVPPAPTPPGSPRRGPKTALLVVLALFGAVVLGFLGQSMTAVIGLVAVVVVCVVAAMVRNKPTLILPALVYSMWFEGLGSGQVNAGRLVAAMVPILILALIATTAWRPRALEPRAWLPVALLVTWAWAGGLYAVASTGWFFYFLTLFLGVVYYVGMAVFLEGPEQLERLLRNWLFIGAPIAGLGAIIYFLLGARVSGLSGGPNTYAAYVAEAIPLLVLFARRERGRRRVLMYLLIPVYLGGLLATGSRGGMIATGVVGMYCFATLPGLSKGRRLFAIVGGGIMMFGALLVFGLLNADRFSIAALLTDRGAGRLDIWNAGMQVMKDHWLIGLGMGGFPTRAIQYIQNADNGQIEVLQSSEVIEAGGINTHNLYLGLTLDMGIIGLSLYLAVIASTMKNLWDLRKTRWADLAWAFQGTLIGSLAAGMFGAQFNHKFLWLIVGAAASIYYRHRLTPRPGLRGLVSTGVRDGSG